MSALDHLSFFDASDETEHGPEAEGPVGASSAQYLVFVVSGMEMAVALASVSEIVPYERVSELPGMPAYVRGIVHVRERVIPVVDLAVKLDRRSERVTKRSCILMLELPFSPRRGAAYASTAPTSAGQEGSPTHEGKLPVGIVMDGVATLLDLAHSQIRSAPRLGTQIEARYVQGLVPTERGMLPIIDFSRLFAEDELGTVAAIANEAATELT